MRARLPLTPAAVALCALAGCYATNTAPATRTASLREGGHGREVVLEQGPTGTHIGPRSWLRFDLRDGSRSRWFEAGTMRVNHEVVLTSDGPAGAAARGLSVEGLRWDQVETVEVNDFDLGETMAGVTAGAALIVTAATAEVLLLAVLESMTEGRIPRDLGITRAAVEVVAGKALQRPPEHPAARAMMLDASAAAEPDVRPLFSSEARRRDLVLFTVSSEAGVDAVLAPAPVAGVAAGVRIDNFLDLQLGARGVLTPGHGRPARARAQRTLSPARAARRSRRREAGGARRGRRLRSHVGGDLRALPLWSARARDRPVAARSLPLEPRRRERAHAAGPGPCRRPRSLAAQPARAVLATLIPE